MSEPRTVLLTIPVIARGRVNYSWPARTSTVPVRCNRSIGADVELASLQLTLSPDDGSWSAIAEPARLGRDRHPRRR